MHGADASIDSKSLFRASVVDASAAALAAFQSPSKGRDRDVIGVVIGAHDRVVAAGVI